MSIRRDDVMVVKNRLAQVGLSFKSDVKGNRSAVFECECKRRIIAVAWKIRNGQIMSCGCLKKEKNHETPLRHGHAVGGKRTKAYHAWESMVGRCTCLTNRSWKMYGGRGITVSERWLKFENFLDDMGEPASCQSLDRLDNNGNYSKDNCRWANASQQNRNTRRNRILEHQGKRQCVAAWAEEKQIPSSVLFGRLDLGWSEEESIMTPYTKRSTKMLRSVSDAK